MDEEGEGCEGGGEGSLASMKIGCLPSCACLSNACGFSGMTLHSLLLLLWLWLPPELLLLLLLL